jgi:SHAQKYF class myb-like DNA-binding protein
MQQQGSPMDVSVLTTPVETPKLTMSLPPPPLGGGGVDVGEMMSNNCNKEEKVGRWSEQEHKVFLEGLERYGKQWKTIALMIGTRTVVQVRTHAQKYFQKMERKNKDNSSSGSNNKHNTATGSVAGSVSTCSSSASATATAAAALLVSTPIPSPRMTTVKAATSATKRKSLTGGGAVTAVTAGSLGPPSRKKSKSPKKAAPRMVSISLSTTSPPPSVLEL